jgi:uncharacterized protein (TIGR02596 family)
MMRGFTASRRKRWASFTLVELLVVMAIIAIIAGISLGALLQLTQSSALNTTTNLVVDQLNFARQQALTLNRRVEVRFYDLPAPNSSATIYRGLQSFVINESNTATNAVSKPVIFPPQVQIASSITYSTLLDPSRTDIYTGTGSAALVQLPSVGLSYSYVAFRFRSDGSTTLTSSVLMTLNLINNPPVGSTLPKNWSTIQVDPLTGRVETFRP